MLRKLIKFALVSAAALFGVVVIASGAVYMLSQRRLNQTLNVQVRPVVVPTDAATIERGRHIVQTRACNDCHGKDFGGFKVIDDPMAGTLCAPNITHGSGGLPADYTDMDYVRAIRHGLDRTGRPLVLMPSAEYTAMCDEDLGAVIAYLKTLPSVDRARGPIKLGPAIRTMIVAHKMNLAAEQIDHSLTRPTTVARDVTVAYGKYLAMGCTGCHGTNLSGGKIPGTPPDWPLAANLTPDASTRVSKWSEQDFMNTLRNHKRPDGTDLHPIMPAAVGLMTDDELKALWLYVKSIPASPQGVHPDI